ncbi:MAG: HAD family hydrolase [Phascolarctobacterium sp.]|nr:HAD family hydrolase [Phascolarctobacterium sp.]
MIDKNYKAVIFDLDGTLIDSLADLADSANCVLKEYGFPIHDLESYKYRVGDGIRKLMERALPPGNDAIIDDALAKYREIYAVNSLNKTRPYDGILGLLEILRRKKINMGICTNKPDAEAKKIADALFSGYFSSIIGDRPDMKRKPDPQKISFMAEVWGISPDKIVYLGDSGVDMQTAVNGKMLPVGVLWGFRSKDELLENGAEILISHPFDLLKEVNFAG